MSDTNYLNDGFDPSTNYLGAGSDPSTNFLGDGMDADAVIGAVFAEDEFGVVPGDVFGAEAFAKGKTPAVTAAMAARQALENQKLRAAAQARQAQQASMKQTLARASQQSGMQASRIAKALQVSQAKRAAMIRSIGVDATAGTMGAGELDYSVKSPPGIGRIQSVQFQVIAPANNALCVVGDQPVVVAAGTAAGQQVLQTPQMPWAVVRVIGVAVHRTVDNPGAGAPDVYFLSGLATNNGTPLFIVNGNNNANFYLAGLELRGGLRDYPILRAPNVMDLVVSWQNAISTAGTLTTAGATIINVELLVDVLADDDYGAHLPGPYARTEGLIRKPIGKN